MIVGEYMAKQTRRVADSLAHFIRTMPEERLDWLPGGAGSARSAQDQVAECVQVNRSIAALLRGEAWPSGPPGAPPAVRFGGSEDAAAQILQSGEELAQAIEPLSVADLEREYQHPRALIRGENLIMMPYRNMAYHAGQVNFIQCLYGDPEFHVPGSWR